MKKPAEKPSQPHRFRFFFRELLLAFAAVVLLAGAVYALIGAGSLQSTLVDTAARTAAASVKAVISETAAIYSDDLSRLHLKIDAQDTRFDDLCGLLARTARANGIDRLVTVARRTGDSNAGYAYILDSRFSRKLTPNVDYHTVGSACSLREQGGAQLERMVPLIESGEQEYGFVTIIPKEGVPYMVCAFALRGSDGVVLGTVLADLSGGLFAKQSSLALPFYILAALLLTAALLTLLILWVKYRDARRIRQQEAVKPEEPQPDKAQPACLPEETQQP